MTSTSHTPPHPEPDSSGANSFGGEQAWSGPWANDARKLFRMLSEGDGTGHDATSHATPAECRYCPLCQGMTLIRKQGPEILDRVSELAAGLAATLRATAGQPDPADPVGPADLGDAADPSDPRAHAADGGAPDAGAGPERPPIPATVRIDITD